MPYHNNQTAFTLQAHKHLPPLTNF